MLRLISYLAPSIPHGFFEFVGDVISRGTGIDVLLRFDERISGPLPGDENPFGDESADIGFVCSPTYRWLRQVLELLPVPVPTDERAENRPVYFGDVVVRADSPFDTFESLQGHKWAYNDRNSRSGWFSMIDRIAPLSPQEFFSELVDAGSHLESLRMVKAGLADAAAIDSNVLLNEGKRKVSAAELRIIESFGPFPIQPVVIRSGLPKHVKNSVRKSLLRAHQEFSPRLLSFGFTRFTEVDSAAYET